MLLCYPKLNIMTSKIKIKYNGYNVIITHMNINFSGYFKSSLTWINSIHPQKLKERGLRHKSHSSKVPPLFCGSSWKPNFFQEVSKSHTTVQEWSISHEIFWKFQCLNLRPFDFTSMYPFQIQFIRILLQITFYVKFWYKYK